MRLKRRIIEKSKEELAEENRALRKKLREPEKNPQNAPEPRRDKEFRQRLSSLLNHLKDPVFIFNSITFQFSYFNQAALTIYRYSREDFKAMTPFELLKSDDFARFRDYLENAGTGESSQFSHFTSDHRMMLTEIILEPIFFDEQNSWFMIVRDITGRRMMEEELANYRSRMEQMVNEKMEEVSQTAIALRQEIMERKKAQAAILQSEKRLRSILEKSLDGIMLIDEKGSIIEWNKAQEGIFGISRAMVVGNKIWDIQHRFKPHNEHTPNEYEKLRTLWEEFFDTGMSPLPGNIISRNIIRTDKSEKEIQELYFAIASENGYMMACTSRDITAQSAMERQLKQSQKLEAMGSLAGGIAHDFNNILSGVMGYTELAIRQTDEKSPTQKYLRQILSASKRATDLVKQILTFSRREEKKKEPVQIALIISEVLKLIRTTVPATIEILARMDARDSWVMADPTQIHQVLMNLCTNAAHAMEEKGGVLEVRLKEEMVDAGIYKELNPGLHLRLSISDTGHGIDAGILDKIFEPFFTTKKEGRGTGMGLAVVHGIITGHNGHISVYSKVGEGTTFSILLPATVDLIQKQENEREELPRGGECLLLVEDDDYLLEAEKKMLEELGYTVIALHSGVEALKVFRRVPKRFHLLITDLVMPKMKGDDLIREIREIRKDLPVIICTGYFERVSSRLSLGELAVDEVIIKPIDVTRFSRTIRRILDRHIQVQHSYGDAPDPENEAF